MEQPEWRKTLMMVKPDTVIGWHRRGFRFYWKWKSRRGCDGRPGTPKEIRSLIREMSTSNVTWGAPRVNGELLKLGIEVSQATVAKYMVKLPEIPGARKWIDSNIPAGTRPSARSEERPGYVVPSPKLGPRYSGPADFFMTDSDPR